VKLYFTRLWCPVQRKHQRWFCDQPNKRFVGLPIIITFYPNAILFLLLNFGIHFDLNLFSRDRVFALHLNPSFWISSLHITFFFHGQFLSFLFPIPSYQNWQQIICRNSKSPRWLRWITRDSDWCWIWLCWITWNSKSEKATWEFYNGNTRVPQHPFFFLFLTQGPKGRARIWLRSTWSLNRTSLSTWLSTFKFRNLAPKLPVRSKPYLTAQSSALWALQVPIPAANPATNLPTESPHKPR